MVISIDQFHKKGGDDIPVTDGGTGQSTSSAAAEALGAPSLVNIQSTAVGNVGFGEDDLQSFILPPNLLNATGEALEATLWGDFNGAGAKDGQLKIIWGSQTLITTNTTATQPWTCKVCIIRTGSTAQVVMAELSINGTAPIVATVAGTQDLTTSVTLKTTGENLTDTINDVVVQTATVAKKVLVAL